MMRCLISWVRVSRGLFCIRVVATDMVMVMFIIPNCKAMGADNISDTTDHKPISILPLQGKFLLCDGRAYDTDWYLVVGSRI